MRTKSLAVTIVLMMFGNPALFDLQVEAQSQARAVVPATQTTSYYGALPLTFEANQGQTTPQVNFLSRSGGYTAFLTTDGMTLSLPSASATTGQSDAETSSAAAGLSSNTILRFKLIGAASQPVAVGEGLQTGKVNYFIGNDSTKWHTNVPTYARVRYRNVYPGIDLVYYGNNRQLEYDFAISPGADPTRIQFEITGANSTRLDSQGNLVLNTDGGELHFQAPMVYQESNGVRVPVQGEYEMNDSTHIGFHLSAFDPTKPMVIDPVLAYATYLGGSTTDQATGIAVDANGNVYVSGYAEETDFPLVERPMRSSPPDTTKVFVAKLDPTGSTLIYADYFGGNGNDQGYALTLDSANDAYVTGSTSSSDYPLINPYQSSLAGTSNAFITEISADGSSLVYSTYFGGNGSDTPAAIALDSSSNIALAGNTTSTNFPVANAYQSTASASQGGLYGYYGFLTKFASGGSQLLYSTYFAGNTTSTYNCGGNSCYLSPLTYITGLALDSSGDAYVGGNTNTYNFPTTTGVYQTTNSTSQNTMVGFVGEFNSSGGLNYSTYFYESSGNLTTIAAIAVDSSGSAYVTGNALSDGTFPVTSTTICNPSNSGEACSYAYVTKFDTAGATLLYATFLGEYNYATPAAISLDANDDAYVLASTASSSFQIVNGIETFSSEGSQYLPGDNDVLLAEIDANADSQLFATYLGGSGNNTSAAMALDASGDIYVAGTTDSTDFPTSQGSFQENLGGNTDAFIAKIAPSSAAAVSLSPYSLQYSAQAVGTTSSSQAVLLRNMGSAGLAITSIATTGDFAQSNDCNSSVAAASTCKLVVTFTPSTIGSLSGTISVSDSGLGSLHIISLSGVGSGALGSLAPGGLTFSAMAVGTTSAPQTVSLTNSGNAIMNISSIAVSGDYSETNNCGASVGAGSSCQIQISFTPTATGTRNGILTVTDDALNSPQTLAITGTGQAATGITLTASSLSFSGQTLDSSSSSQVIGLTNNESSSVTVSHVTVTGAFTQTNNCSVLAANGGTCSITVAFAPSVSGLSSGALTISDSAGTQTVGLTGTGLDFSLASPTTTETIQAGGTATYTVTVSPVGGSFPNAIQLNCSGLPAGATCSFSQNSPTPNANPVNVTLRIATTTSVAQASPNPFLKGFTNLALWVPLQGLGLFGIVFAGWTKRSKKAAVPTLLGLIVLWLIFMSACAGGLGVTSPNQTGTSTSYKVTVNGTSGKLEHSEPLTLNVQ